MEEEEGDKEDYGAGPRGVRWMKEETWDKEAEGGEKDLLRLLCRKKSNIFILGEFCKRRHGPSIETLALLFFLGYWEVEWEEEGPQTADAIMGWGLELWGKDIS